MVVVFGWIDRSASSADLVLGNGSRALTCIALHRNDLDLSRCPSKTRTAAHWQSSLWTFLIVSSDGGSQKQNDQPRKQARIVAISISFKRRRTPLTVIPANHDSRCQQGSQAKTEGGWMPPRSRRRLKSDEHSVTVHLSEKGRVA